MESFILAASVVVPLVVYMTVGALIRKAGIFRVEHFKALNVMLFKIFIPLSLFFNVYHADMGKMANPSIFIFVFLCVLVAGILAWVLMGKAIPDRRISATVTQGIVRSNFVLFGMTIASAMCDSDGVALVAALSAVVVPTFNILAVILFEMSRGGKPDAVHLVKSILKNPLVEAGFLGAAFNLLHIPLPSLVEEPLMNLGSAATPVALVTLGGVLSFKSMVSHKKYLVMACTGSLVILPLITVAVGAAFGFRNNELIAILAVFATPTAVASAPMAQAMGGDGDLAGEIVATTSVLCVFTLFIFVLSLSMMGYIGL